MIEIEPSSLMATRLKLREPDNTYAPSELAERFLHCRAQYRTARIKSDVISEHLTLGTQPIGTLEHLVRITVGGLWRTSLAREALRNVGTTEFFGLAPDEYIEEDADKNYLEPIFFNRIHAITCPGLVLGETYHNRFKDDPQGVFVVRSDSPSISESETQRVALTLLRELAPGEAKFNFEKALNYSNVDFERTFSKDALSAVVAAAGLLVQLGAAVVERDGLRLTPEGLRLLHMSQRIRTPVRSKGTGSWRKKLFLSGFFATLATAIIASKAALKRAAAAVSDRKSADTVDVKTSRPAINEDPNYLAYLRDLPKLQQQHQTCVVAYARGNLVALGKDIKDLESKVPPEYWKERLLIKDVPEKPIRVRPRLRVAS